MEESSFFLYFQSWIKVNKHKFYVVLKDYIVAYYQSLEVSEYLWTKH